ncbi:hypothetical protein [Flavobacterium haoranii]|uniref:hypothetical protein n=1 Tax=Flavobacterium haoranii TaxID=683124 RepID=UPI000933B8CF|nr:hypothetical protein [Flavobacterium haoranii]
MEKPRLGISEGVRKSNMPSDYKLFEFDYTKFKSKLINVPKRGEFFGQSSVIVSVPNPDGTLTDYRIIEASNFEDILQDKFPEIRSFAGNAVDNSGSVIRFSV